MKTLFQAKNIPNFLSGYRLVALPVLFWAIYAKERELYVWLLCINLISDILDGFLARKFKWESEFGARLDSTADFGTYLAAFAGMIFIEQEFFMDHLLEFGCVIAFFFIPQIICFVRFGRNTSMHLYSSKIAGYIQGIFFFTYFVFGNFPWYFYFMIAFSFLNFLEELIIILAIKEPRSNMKGLYWVRKNHRK